MPALTKKLNAVLTLGRVSNLPTVWTNCIAAWILNQLGSELSLFVLPDSAYSHSVQLNLVTLIWIVIGSSLVYVSGTTLNDAFDFEFDRKHNKERPIPSGVMKPWEVWLIGVSELFLGFYILFDLVGVNIVCLILLCAVIIAYDAVHKKWSGSVWLMGGCRLLLWWTIASAAMPPDRPLSNLVYIWSITLLIYIAGITFVARGEATGRLPSFPWPFFFLFSPVLLGGFFCLYYSKWIVIPIVLLLGWCVLKGVRFAKSKGPGIGKGVALWLALITVADALAISLVDPLLGYCLLIGFPLCLWTQKYFAAT